ncbi:uncharacterized protein LOC119458283 isoform X2 [Dermacentor silvarum]|uniref:uncharacterized protein LOC119458283 isoform X2 n=1 Tax=Dermacentor silvarum TaxID=543639 RepID=UPI0021007BE5|nr:uncharacterized protein LOC119458283 isoform X2 [Dermacentor silvarum]
MLPSRNEHIAKQTMKRLPILFVFILLLSTVVALRGDLSTLKQLLCTTCDIKKFFNTDEVIWTLRSTERLKLQCKVDVKINITDTFVLFRRHFYLKGNRINVTINGTFASLDERRNTSGKYDTILLADPGHPEYGYEHLLYQAEDSSCGVLLVALNEAYMWLEIRVRNSTVDKPDQTCVKRFRQLLPVLKGKRRLVYNRDCQRILDQINE